MEADEATQPDARQCSGCTPQGVQLQHMPTEAPHTPAQLGSTARRYAITTQPSWTLVVHYTTMAWLSLSPCTMYACVC